MRILLSSRLLPYLFGPLLAATWLLALWAVPESQGWMLDAEGRASAFYSFVRVAAGATAVIYGLFLPVAAEIHRKGVVGPRVPAVCALLAALYALVAWAM
jgi:hypothetical protein